MQATCIICSGTSPLIAGNDYFRCSECGHEILGQPAQTFIINDAIPDTPPEGDSALEKFKRRVVLSQTMARETLLDLGSGVGGFLYHMKGKFRRCIGLEVTPECIQFAREKLGLEIFSDLNTIQATPSAVTAWHSLEHFPSEALTSVVKWLSSACQKDTPVVISVPNADSFQYRWFGKGYAYYDVPNHIHQFTARSLDHLMEEHGFERKKAFYSFAYVSFGYVQGLLNLFNSRHNYFYYRKKRGWDFGLTKTQQRRTDWYNLALLIPLLPISLALSALDLLIPSRSAVLTHSYQKR